MAPKKRMAADKEPSTSSQPPPKKAAGKQRDTSPSPEANPSKPAQNQPEDYPEPPEALFDAEIDLSATLATNAAAFNGDNALERHLQQWRQFAVPRLGEDQRVAVQIIAAFVEAGRAEGRLTGGKSSAAQGCAAAVGPSDPLAARVKSIGELMGGVAGRGHNCLKVNPDAPKDATAHRTLTVEDATLYVLSCYSEEQHAALRGRPGEDAQGGESEGEGFEGVLPMVWAEQLKLWEEEGVDERERHERMGKTIARCLPGLPVFVMKNGGRYLSTSHLKYVLGMEKRAYELFRILREPNRKLDSDREDSDSDSDDEAPSYEASWGPGNNVTLTPTDGAPGAPSALFDPAPNKMVQALSTLAPTSSCEELANVVIKSAWERGDDIAAAGKIAQNQVLALQGGEMRDRFRAAAIRAEAKLLEAAQADGPPPEAFEEMDARMRAFKEKRGAAQAALADQDAGATEMGTADSKGKRVSPERISNSTSGGSGEDQEPGPGEAEYLDQPDPEADTDLMEDDWDRMRDDRPGFNPSDPVPIKTLGEISRFHKEFAVPGQVVVMQRHYHPDLEQRYHGNHNLWTFKVLSNIMPVSRFMKSAPSSETFVAFDLARVALKKFGAEDDRNFGRSLSIAALAHSAGVPVDDDMVHGDGRDLIWMARGLGAKAQGLGSAGSASGSGAAAGPATAEEEPFQQIASALARQGELNARAARARVTMAGVQAAKERLEGGGF